MEAQQPPPLLRHALWLEYVTVGWNIVEAVIAIGAGWLARSIALIGFGLDSVIEIVAASMVLWRLRCELRCEHTTHVPAERRALWVVGVTFWLLAAYVAFQAGSMLLLRQAPQASPAGVVLAFISATLMPGLGYRKRVVAARLNSQSLAADAIETLMCAYLSLTVLMGVGLNAWLGWWWADPVAALIMLPLIVNEGRKAIRAANALGGS